MLTIPKYSPTLHAPATARTQLVPTCRHARYAEIRPMNPLTGIWITHRTDLGYRHASPDGERQNCPVKALPNPHSVSTTPPPFRHTPCRCWLQETPPVWRNLRQNPRLFLQHSLPVWRNLPQPTPNSQLLTANWIFTFSAKERDPETGLSYFGSRYYSSDLSVWLSVDPMAHKYPSLSPYVYCANNPVKLVDPNGESISEFDENGNYIRTIKDNWFHNTFFGHSGRIVDSDGDVLKKFYFSDPKHDFEDIKNNVINKIQFVQESEINKMLSKAGAFDEDNKVFSSQGRYSYIQKEGKGGGKFDFSYTGIPFQYPEASRYPLDNPSHIMFLVDNVAYNHMNFGNYLYGAAGKALGLTLNELKIGAHYNSLFNSQSNKYKPQFDSRDDQKCIEMGVRYAKRHGYQNKFFHVVVGYVNNRF